LTGIKAIVFRPNKKNHPLARPLQTAPVNTNDVVCCHDHRLFHGRRQPTASIESTINQETLEDGRWVS
jgi:hypothetical protein